MCRFKGVLLSNNSRVLGGWLLSLLAQRRLPTSRPPHLPSYLHRIALCVRSHALSPKGRVEYRSFSKQFVDLFVETGDQPFNPFFLQYAAIFRTAEGKFTYGAV